MSSATGRFTTKKALARDPRRERSANAYIYALNDPIDFVDPLGVAVQCAGPGFTSACGHVALGDAKASPAFAKVPDAMQCPGDVGSWHAADAYRTGGFATWLRAALERLAGGPPDATSATTGPYDLDGPPYMALSAALSAFDPGPTTTDARLLQNPPLGDLRPEARLAYSCPGSLP